MYSVVLAALFNSLYYILLATIISIALATVGLTLLVLLNVKILFILSYVVDVTKQDILQSIVTVSEAEV